MKICWCFSVKHFLKCSVHLALTSLLLLMRFPFLSRTVVLCLALSLHRIFVSPYIVFMSCLFAASSALSAMSSIQFLSSAFILLLNSQSFSAYFALICPLTLSDRVLRIFFYRFLPFGLQGSMIRHWCMVSSSFVVYLELYSFVFLYC